MSSTAAGWLQFTLLVVALAACYVPLGNYMARIFTDTRHWRVERGLYKLFGVDPAADMRWSGYPRPLLPLSPVRGVFPFPFRRGPPLLLLFPRGAHIAP